MIGAILGALASAASTAGKAAATGAETAGKYGAKGMKAAFVPKNEDGTSNWGGFAKGMMQSAGSGQPNFAGSGSEPVGPVSLAPSTTEPVHHPDMMAPAPSGPILGRHMPAGPMPQLPPPNPQKPRLAALDAAYPGPATY